MTEQAQVLRPSASTDRYNDAQLTYPAEPSHVVDVTGFDPGSSSEDNDGRRATATVPTLYTPGLADVAANDRVQLRGRTFDVIGVPAVWTDPDTGEQVGTVIELREVRG